MKDSRPSGDSWFAQGASSFASSHLVEPCPQFREALRVLSMVRALHEEGYQRIRAFGSLAPSGAYWRCAVTSADNVEENGWRIRDGFSDVANFTTGAGTAPFGWEDAGDMAVRELAAMFVERFPRIAKRGAGCDQAYANWFAGMMATAETGRLPIFDADFEIDLSDVRVPPPPGRPPADRRHSRVRRP